MPLTAERNKLVEPVIEFQTEDGYVLRKYQRGPVLTLTDPFSGLTVSTLNTNPRRRGASEKAWAGARYSRSGMAQEEIVDEMLRKGNADEKLADTAKKTGHASIGDLAHVQFDFDGSPIHLMSAWFLEGWGNGGQERSTRFQKKFYESVLHEIKNYLPKNLPKKELEKIEKSYQALGAFALSLHRKHYEEVVTAFTQRYKPETKEQQDALVARSLDCARFFLPWGVCSGGTFENSVRDDARIIGNTKASPVLFYGKAAAQVERLFTLTPQEEKLLKVKSEAPSLFRHTEMDATTNDNLAKLKDYLSGGTDILKAVPIRTSFRGEVEQKVYLIPKKYRATERMAAQYILSLWPGMEWKKVLRWVHDQNDDTKEKMGAIMFSGHDRKKQMSYLGRTTDFSAVIQGFVGEDRDYLRHRAWGRFMPIPAEFGLSWTQETAEQIKAMGYGLPLHLDMPGAEKIREGFVNDLTEYYHRVDQFVGDMYKQYGSNISYEFIINLLPLAHHSDLWMHGYPNQLPYLRNLRERGGGHGNYRVSVRELADLFAKSDPFLRSVASTDSVNFTDRLDVFNRT